MHIRLPCNKMFNYCDTKLVIIQVIYHIFKDMIIDKLNILKKNVHNHIEDRLIVCEWYLKKTKRINFLLQFSKRINHFFLIHNIFNLKTNTNGENLRRVWK